MTRVLVYYLFPQGGQTRAAFFLLLVCMLFITSLEAAQADPGQPEISGSHPEIMTTRETSRFLRLSPAMVRRLARKGVIPGRRIGRYWRFSRSALIRWLAWDLAPPKGHQTHLRTPKRKQSSKRIDPIPPPLPFASPIKGDQLEESNLPSITGLGVVNSSPNSQGSKQSSRTPIGEDPQLSTAEEVLLRAQQVLLAQNEITAELTVFYTKVEQDSTPLASVSTSGTNLVTALGDTERDILTSQLTVRYGLPFDAQAIASLPFIYQETTSTITLANTPSNAPTTSGLQEFGDLLLEIDKTLIREKPGVPSIIARIEGRIPTRLNSYAAGGGVSLVKQFDPVVLFASGNYRYVFSQTFRDTTRLQPHHIVDSQFGWALSMTDTLAVSTSLIGTFTSSKTFHIPAQIIIPSSELFSLRLSLTALLTEGLYIEPFLTFSLNGPSTVSAGISLPYTFSLSSLLS